MQFPVILLALSLYLNWLHCPNFGSDPRSWLPEPVCDISGLVRAGNTPSMLYSNSLSSQTVGLDRLCEIAHQRKKYKLDGKGSDKKSEAESGE